MQIRRSLTRAQVGLKYPVILPTGERITVEHPSTKGVTGLPTFVPPGQSQLGLSILWPHEGATHFFASTAPSDEGTDVPLYLALQSVSLSPKSVGVPRGRRVKSL